MNEFSKIKAVFDKTHRLFVWKADEDVYGTPEHWTSHADAVEREEIFFDDCDGFAMTCVELLLREGINPEDMRLVTCWTETNEYHAVAIVHGWLLDNRMRRMYPWPAVPYKWHKSMKMSAPGLWLDATEEGVPF